MYLWSFGESGFIGNDNRGKEEGKDFSDIGLKDLQKYFSSTKWNKLSHVSNSHVRRRYDNGTYRDFDYRAIVTTCKNPEIDIFWAQVLGRNDKPLPEVFDTQKKFWSKLKVKIK